MSTQESNDVQFTTADGSIIHIFDKGVWLDVSTKLDFDEFDELVEFVHTYQRDNQSLIVSHLNMITQDLLNRFWNKVQAVKVIGLVSTDHPDVQYTVTILDSRDGLLYDCSNMGEYKDVLRRIPPYIR